MQSGLGLTSGKLLHGGFPTDSAECLCSQNQTVFATIVSTTIRDPSIGGLLGGSSCATACVTSVDFVEEFTNCELPAAEVLKFPKDSDFSKG